MLAGAQQGLRLRTLEFCPDLIKPRAPRDALLAEERGDPQSHVAREMMEMVHDKRFYEGRKAE